MDEIIKCDREIKTAERYFSVLLFIMLYKVVLTLESVVEFPSVIRFK